MKINSSYIFKIYTKYFILFGCIAIILAFFVDELGYGDSGSFGIGQLLMMLLGLVLILIGILGRKFIQFYQNTAIILLNVLVFLAVIELVSIIIGKQLFFIKHSGIQELSYYADQDWTKAYWLEAQLAQGVRYKPYIVWRHRPFSGAHINFDREGLRQIPGVNCRADAYKVFVFGGSTMLGWGAPDWGTIPAYLHKDLEALIEGPVCIVNFAEDGFVSTQSLIALLLQLQSENIPNTVIFYDGINEVIAAHESERPSDHVTLANIAGRFEQQKNLLIAWAKSTRTYTLIKHWMNQLKREKQGDRQHFSQDQIVKGDRHHLAKSVVSSYLNNYKIVSTLAQKYNFHYFFSGSHI